MQRTIVILLFCASIAAGYFVYQFRGAAPEEMTVAASAPDPADAPPAVTHRPEFSLAGLDGEFRSISEWDDRALVINFWATWCPPCRREIPLLKALQEEYSNRQVQIVGIAVDFPDAVAEYAEAEGFNYPILMGEQDAVEAAEGFGIDFVGLPFTIFTDYNGRILRRHTGELHRAEAVAILETVEKIRTGDLTDTQADAELSRRLVEVADATGRPVPGGAR